MSNYPELLKVESLYSSHYVRAMATAKHIAEKNGIELNVDERLEKELERVCKKLFNATMFNFACLMNNAYRDNEKPHVHFHFIPRYKEKVELFGKIYCDKHFGYNFWKWALSRFKSQKDIFTKEERIKIYEMMKEEFNYGK